MRAIDADALKEDLTRFYDNEVTARKLIDEQPTIQPEITHEQAVEYLQSTGWMREHDLQMMLDGVHRLTAQPEPLQPWEVLAAQAVLSQPTIQPDNGLQKLADEIATFKRCVKSENSDYLTGYLCALSAVEGMIAERREVTT